jgi:hypothetical protein
MLDWSETVQGAVSVFKVYSVIARGNNTKAVRVGLQLSHQSMLPYIDKERLEFAAF